MSTSLSHVENEEELDACFECMSKAFGRAKPLLNALYPHHDTPQGRSNGVRRLKEAWRAHRDDPTFHYLKVTVDEIIAGFAIWVLIDADGHNLSNEDADKEFDLNAMYSDNEEDAKQWLRQVWRAYVQPRQQVVMLKRSVMALELCVVHPEYQRRGIGQMLTAWGVRQAPTLGAKVAVVEASVPGVGCYARCGFVHRSAISFDCVDERLERDVRKLPDLMFMQTDPF